MPINGHVDDGPHSSYAADAAVQTMSIYTWRDASLGEITDMMATEMVEVNLQQSDDAKITQRESPAAAAAASDPARCRLAYRLVYGDTDTNSVRARDLGVVSLRAPRTAYDGRVTLESCKFAVGDLLDVAVLRPGDALYNFAPTKGGDHGYKLDFRTSTSLLPQDPGDRYRHGHARQSDAGRGGPDQLQDYRGTQHDPYRDDDPRKMHDVPPRRGLGGRMARFRSRSPARRDD